MEIKCLSKDLSGLLGEILNKNKSVYLRATGGSMHPAIKELEQVKIEPIKDKIRRHDIVLYRNPEQKLCIHRVINIFEKGKETMYLIRGDNSDAAADLVPGNHIMGRIVAVCRNGQDIPVKKIKGRIFWLLSRLVNRRLPFLLRKTGFKT